MTISPSAWANNIKDDLRALSDDDYQAGSFSGRLRNADSHPGEMIATIWNDDRLESFVDSLPSGDIQEAGFILIAAINRLAEHVNFDSSWQQIVLCDEWQKVADASLSMLRTMEAAPNRAGRSSPRKAE